MVDLLVFVLVECVSMSECSFVCYYCVVIGCMFVCVVE